MIFFVQWDISKYDSNRTRSVLLVLPSWGFGNLATELAARLERHLAFTLISSHQRCAWGHQASPQPSICTSVNLAEISQGQPRLELSRRIMILKADDCFKWLTLVVVSLLYSKG